MTVPRGSRTTVAGHDTIVRSSVTSTGPVRVTMEVFVSVYVYVISSPTAA